MTIDWCHREVWEKPPGSSPASRRYPSRRLLVPTMGAATRHRSGESGSKRRNHNLVDTSLHPVGTSPHMGVKSARLVLMIYPTGRLSIYYPFTTSHQNLNQNFTDS